MLKVDAKGDVSLSWTSPTTSNLYSVFMVNASDGWAVGSDGTIIRWNGTNWSTWASPTTRRLLSVFMVDTSDGWAVGYEGTIIRWIGTEWTPEFSGATFILPLTSLTLIAVIFARGASKERRRAHS